MNLYLEHKSKKYFFDVTKPLDISIPLVNSAESVNAFYLPIPQFTPFQIGSFIGSKEQNGPCNCEILTIAPHGNGTHTESVGHISKERISINSVLQRFIFIGQIITVLPTIIENGDAVIQRKALEDAFDYDRKPECLVIRTTPNSIAKRAAQYSGTNPTYLSAEAAKFLVEQNIEHLLIDTPSVDREEDNGILTAHHIFWQYPDNTRRNCTITELIYVPDEIRDGLYIVNLQIASFETDASPSKPVLYSLTSYDS